MTRTRGELGVTPEEIISHKEIKKNGKYYRINIYLFLVFLFFKITH